MSTQTPCERSAELLSAYVDAELSEQEAGHVQAHLDTCCECQSSCDALVALKRDIADIKLPEPASLRIWEGVGNKLRTRRSRLVWAQLTGGALNPELRLAAATFIVALGLGYAYPYLAARSTAAPPTSGLVATPFALTVGDYVEHVSAGSPDAFWHKYKAVDAMLDAVAEPLEFRPRMPDTLPGGYRLTSAKLLKDVCCYTVQLRYESPQDKLDVFECHDDHPVSFGAATASRGTHSGIAYTSFAWEGTDLVGRIFSADDVNIILVGDLDDELANQLTEELRSASD